MRKTLVLLAALAFSTSAMAQGILWDNDLIPDEFSARAISPPNFPDIRVVDDFVIPDGEEWIIQDFHTNIIEDDVWTDGGVAEIYIWDDTGNPGPGNLIVTLSNLPFSKMKTGLKFFGRLAYDYWIEDLNIPLGPGRYWIGSRYPNGGGGGTNYWMTSTGQPDGPDTSGYLSLDGGATWLIEGDPDWDHAFTITGIPSGGACPEDLNGDGQVGVKDLLQLLGAWGECPGGNPAQCDKPGTCDNGFPNCGGGPDCVCITLFDGSGLCVQGAFPCGGLELCPDGDCPPGQFCAVLTCCGDNVCVPQEAFCGNAGAAPPPPGTKTISGVAGRN